MESVWNISISISEVFRFMIVELNGIFILTKIKTFNDISSTTEFLQCNQKYSFKRYAIGHFVDLHFTDAGTSQAA